MTSRVTKGAYAGLLAISLAVTLASCATDAPAPPPPPPPTPIPVAPPVALAPEISDAAAVYVDYVNRARAISANFTDGDNVQSQLRDGETFEPKQLARGVVAYGAIVAMQDPDFRNAFRGFAANSAQRADMVSRLISDPTYAGSIATSDTAARRVIQALSADGAGIYKSGSDVKQAAYDIQHQKWSTQFIADRDSRLALAKQNSVTLASVQSDHSAKLLTAALTGQGMSVPSGSRALSGQATATPATSEAPVAPVALGDAISSYTQADLYQKPYTQTVNEALTIAALAIMGEGGADKTDTLTQMLNQNEGASCLNMSKLNLYQCLAVAKPYYEDVFCLGQHVLMDTGQCLGKMSSNALSFAPVIKVGFKADGTSAYSDPKPYITPPAPLKKKKGGATKSKGKASTTKSSTAKKK